MAAYLIVDVDVTDPDRYAEYIKAVPGTIEAFGGRYLARAGETVVLEGDWQPKRFVLLEFPSVERAKEWWDSDAYREPKAIRRRSSRARIVLTEGLSRAT